MEQKLENFEIFNNKKYKLVNARDYVLNNTGNLFTAIKTTSVTATQGYVGQNIVTGQETKSIVSYDKKTGEADWIVTNNSGKQMIICDSVFKKLYTLNNSATNEYSPTNSPRLFMSVSENIAIMTPWGEMNYIDKNGMLAINASNDIYGITNEEFKLNYKPVVVSDNKKLLDEKLKTVHDNNRPKVFLSVANPHSSASDQEFMKDVIKYLNANGIQTINIKQTDSSDNFAILREIQNVLNQCNGILSLAFNRDLGHTSPFIHIESSLALSMELTNLTLLPKEVYPEGVLFDKSNETNVIKVDTSKSLFSENNLYSINHINKFIEEVIANYSYNLTNKDLAQFKRKSKQSQEDLLSFLKAFYQVKHLDFELTNIFVKRPTQIIAAKVKKDGTYDTQNGETQLKKGDYIILANRDTSTTYAVSQKQFEIRYKKCRGTKNLYATKLSPVAISKGDKTSIKVTPLADPTDTYFIDIQDFSNTYISLTAYLKNMQDTLESANQNDLSI